MVSAPSTCKVRQLVRRPTAKPREPVRILLDVQLQLGMHACELLRVLVGEGIEKQLALLRLGILDKNRCLRHFGLDQ